MYLAVRKALTLMAVMALPLFVVAGPVSAQTIVNNPAETLISSPGQVDMSTGRFAYNETDLSAGPLEKGGVELSRVMAPVIPNHASPFGNMSHNWDITISEKRGSVATADWGIGGSDYRMVVNFRGLSDTFESRQSQSFFRQVSKTTYSTLTYSGDRSSGSTIYTYMSVDGTIIAFRPIGSLDCAAALRCAFISQMTMPDGGRFTFDYDYFNEASGNKARLRKVESSAGFALLLEGTNNLVTKACTLNLAITPVPSSNLCGADAIATVTYGYTALRLASVVRADNSTELFTYQDSGGKTDMGFIKPGYAVPWLVNMFYKSIDSEGVLQDVVEKQTFGDGRTLSYTYFKSPDARNKPSTIAGGTYTDNLGARVLVRFAFPVLPGTGAGDPCTPAPCVNTKEKYVYQQTAGPIHILDTLGRATTLNYCDPAAAAGLPSSYHNRCFVSNLQSFTAPEGDKATLASDNYRNIHQVTKKAKSGVVADDIITFATFSCVNLPKSCSKPTSVTDALGRMTSYTYSSVHGGILTETAPAVNGVSPQTRYEYAQRFAWLVNGSGGYVQAASPIWVLVRKRSCNTTAPSGQSCVGGSVDETVTEYDYGPASGPNNLLVRGIAVTAAGATLRTCYTYDAYARKVSETKPNANLGVCP